MARNVRPRRALPEDVEETDQHAWLLTDSITQPTGFQEQFVVVSLLVGALMMRLRPQQELPHPYTACGFTVRRDRLNVVTMDLIKRVFSELIWMRCSEWLPTTQFRLMFNQEPLVGLGHRREPRHISFQTTLLELRQQYPQDRRNLGSSWPVMLLGSELQSHLAPQELVQDPVVFLARPGVEIQFLTAELLPVLTPAPGPSPTTFNHR